MADELVNADQIRAIREGLAGSQSPVMNDLGASAVRRLSQENPYNTEFPDYIGNPPPTELPAIYNERFPPYIEERPALGFSPGPGESRWDAYGVRSAFPGKSYPPAMLPQADPGLGAELRDYRMPTAEFQPAMPLPDPERAARVEQLMRELEEQRALEARLRALGR